MASTIGQWGNVGNATISVLESDGALVIYDFMVAAVSWLGGPWLSWLTTFFAGLAAKFIVSELDNMVFAIYVAAKVGKQVTDYIKAQDAGASGTIDSDADQLINLGE